MQLVVWVYHGYIKSFFFFIPCTKWLESIQSVLLHLYLSLYIWAYFSLYILPHFNYCSKTWHFCNKKSADKLELVNKRALRFVFRDKSPPHEELCKRIGLSSLR